jgi:hypothetical protein
VNNAVLQQFDLQRHRGVQGFGIFDGQFLNMVHETTEDKMLKWLCKYDSNILLMHHRFPTSTKNVKKAAHPFSTRGFFGDNEYILAHNGVIKNADKMFQDHQERGIDYQSLLDDWKFNDSEALLWDFALYMEGYQDDVQSIGDVAFICLKKVKGKLTEMHYYRNAGRPLRFNWTRKVMELSSEGEGDMIPVDVLHTWNYEEETIETTHMQIPEYWPLALYDGGAYRPNETVFEGYDNEYDELFPRDIYGNRFDPIPSPNATDVDSGFDDRFEYDPQEHEDNQLSLHNALRQRHEEIKRQVAAKKEVESEVTASKSEIEIMAMEYLAMYYGHFEQAYWQVESDYDNAMDSYKSTGHAAIKMYIRKLEAVMEFLENDPENVDQNSVSNLWKEVLKQSVKKVITQ